MSSIVHAALEIIGTLTVVLAIGFAGAALFSGVTLPPARRRRHAVVVLDDSHDNRGEEGGPAVNGWQDISTAPTDMSPFLGYGGTIPWPCIRTNLGDVVAIGQNQHSIAHGSQITHWMPLPAPPVRS